MPIQCCQSLAEFMANADYCTEPESCGIYYNPGKTGDTIKFVYCPFCGDQIEKIQYDQKSRKEKAVEKKSDENKKSFG
jgi:uncharacterized Zn finger protein (UPF0148 family)